MPKFNAAFWKWFGKSKVVDARGRPLVVYHGTGHEDLSEFYGGWWSPDKGVSRDFGPVLYSAYLRIERPAYDEDLRSLYEKWSGVPFDDAGGLELNDEAASDGPFGRHVRSKKYDGIITWDESNRYEGFAYVAFNPIQVKSVDNRGTWSRTDPDIRRNPAVGRCFVDAYLAVLKDTKVGPNDAPLSVFDEVAIVHGKARVADAKTDKPKTGPHAWVEFRAGKFWFVYDPANNLLTGRDTYYKDYAAKPSQRYSKAEVTKLRKVHKHCGPFPSGGS